MWWHCANAEAFAGPYLLPTLYTIYILKLSGSTPRVTAQGVKVRDGRRGQSGGGRMEVWEGMAP